MPEAEKYETLLAQLEQRQGTVIIFMKTKFSTERMAKQLTKAGHSSMPSMGIYAKVGAQKCCCFST